ERLQVLRGATALDAPANPVLSRVGFRAEANRTNRRAGQCRKSRCLAMAPEGSAREPGSDGDGPRHLHYDQDEWIYVIDGEFQFEVGDKRFRVGTGESVFIPRKVAHVWACVSRKPGKIINVYQPA